MRFLNGGVVFWASGPDPPEEAAQTETIVAANVCCGGFDGKTASQLRARHGAIRKPRGQMVRSRAVSFEEWCLRLSIATMHTLRACY